MRVWGRCGNRPVGTNAPPEARRRCARRRAKGSRMPGIHTLVRSACWSVLIFSTVSICAGPGVSSVHRPGVPYAGVGQTAMAPTPGMPDTVAQVAPEPPAAPPAVASPPMRLAIVFSMSGSIHRQLFKR